MILVFGGAAVLGIVKKKLPEHAPTLDYVAFGGVCVAILLFTFTGRPIFAPPPSASVTQDNVEEYIRHWADDLGMSIGPANEPNAYFSHTLVLSNGPAFPVVVFRSREKPGYLQFKAVVNVSPEHQAALSKMSEEQVSRIREQLNLDIGRANLGCTFAVITLENTQTHKTIIAGAMLQRGTPVPNLNEGLFGDNFDQLTRGVSLVGASIRMALPYIPPPKGSSPVMALQ